MKWLAPLLVALFSCSKSGPLPVIESFQVDDANPEEDTPITFTFSVTGATAVALFPLPGGVGGSPVTLTPLGSTTFTLVASNANGETKKTLAVTVRVGPPLSIAADAIPARVKPGAAVTLRWTTTGAARVTLTDPAGQVSEVPTASSTTIAPQRTTTYKLTASRKSGASVSTTITARVAVPPTVTSFVATPQAIANGDSSTLTWSGNATLYTVKDDHGGVFEVGPLRKLVVRPASTTTYTLHATGPGGALDPPPTTTVTVDSSRPAVRLVYAAGGSGPLQLVADPCGDPCTAITLRVRASAAMSLRAFALTLPLDVSKVAFDAASFGSSLAGPARATLGTGPLEGALVMGAALRGTGSSAAADVAVPAGAELAHFTLSLGPAGGRGRVFSGDTLAANPVYKAVVQTASGRTANALAVGALDAD